MCMLKINEKLIPASLTKLWENPNPLIDFSTQTITLSSDDYDYLIWFYNEGTMNTASKNKVTSQISLKGYGTILDGIGDEHASGNNNYYIAVFRRNITRTNDTTFDIANCSYKFGTNTSWNSTAGRLIPVAVYGGKF